MFRERTQFPRYLIVRVCGLIATMLSVVADAGAHAGDRVYPLIELTDNMLALIDLKDGSIEDWHDVLGEPTLEHRDFSVELSADDQELTSGDLNFSVWLAWHCASNRIVVGSVFIDNVYHNKYEGGPGDSFTDNDGVILLIDGDHSGPPYGDQSVELWNTEAQMYNAIPEVPEGPSIALTSSSEIGRPGWMLVQPYADAGGHVAGVHPVAWSIEFSVTPFDLIAWDDPEQSRVSSLTGDSIVGLGFFVLDHDAADGESVTIHNLPGTSYLNGWAADGILLSADGGDADSAIESNSWARIKTSLSVR